MGLYCTEYSPDIFMSAQSGTSGLLTRQGLQGYDGCSHAVSGESRRRDCFADASAFLLGQSEDDI